MGLSILGLDASISGTAAVRFNLNEDLSIKNISHKAFSGVKSHLSLPGVVFLKKEMFENDMERFKYIREVVLNFAKGCTHVAIEGYSMGSKGMVFNIAEFSGIIKMGLFEAGNLVRIYAPSSVKMYAGGKGFGKANKIKMREFYDRYPSQKIDLTSFPDVKRPQGITPTSDIIDAFFIADMLHSELLIRHGVQPCKFDPVRAKVMKLGILPKGITETPFMTEPKTKGGFE